MNKEKPSTVISVSCKHCGEKMKIKCGTARALPCPSCSIKPTVFSDPLELIVAPRSFFRFPLSDRFDDFPSALWLQKSEVDDDLRGVIGTWFSCIVRTTADAS